MGKLYYHSVNFSLFSNGQMQAQPVTPEMEERTSKPLTTEVKEWMQQLIKESNKELESSIQSLEQAMLDAATVQTNILRDTFTTTTSSQTRRLQDTIRGQTKHQTAKIQSQISDGMEHV